MRKTAINPEEIDTIRKRYHKEWLLIAVDKYDRKTTTVLTGHLLAHSPDPLDVHKVACKSRCRHLMTVYSNDWPEDLAAAFHVYLSFDS